MRGILLTAAAGALILSSSALAAIDVIFCEVPGNSKSLVPAGTGLPATAEFELFDRPFRSPDGTRWIIQAQVAPPTLDAEDRIIVVFNGTSAQTVVREGLQAPWTLAAETAGFWQVEMGVNNSGHYAFSNNTTGGLDATDQYVVKFDGANHVIAAQEGGTTPVAGGTWGATLDTVRIDNAGQVMFRNAVVTGLATAENSLLMLGSGVLAQKGVTVPTGQLDAGTRAWELFNAESAATGGSYVSGDGTHTLVRGHLTGTTTDDVVVVDGVVKIQEGFVIPASGFVSLVSAFGMANMMSNGDWLARGNNADGVDWMVRNGTVIAATDQPITTGNTETFDDAPFSTTFFWQQGNNNGDWVIGGTTNAADANANAVLVLNGTEVAAREGDMVDLNGNGLADDDAFISVFNNDDGFLTDGLKLYFTADLRNGAGTGIGQAFLRINLAPCVADITGDDTVNVLDLLEVITSWGACVDCPTTPCSEDIANDDCTVNVLDLLAVIVNWGACP